MRTKLLLADDEPLVLIGLQSMLKWETYDIQIVGTAHNGEEAFKMISDLRPDIVIADIKMPRLNGLELMSKCREQLGQLPLFILLTSFEEFKLVKEAIRLQAVDYLVKLELTPEMLAASIATAQKKLEGIRRMQTQTPAGEKRDEYSSFYERFFMRLYNNLFESHEQFELQRRELGVDFSFDAYAVCYCEILETGNKLSASQRIQLYSSTIRMVRETINRFMACYITSLDLRHFNITFCLSEQEVPKYRDVIRDVLEKSAEVVRNYFNVQLNCSVGCKVEDPFTLSESYYTARRVSLLPREAGGPAFFNPDSQDGGAETFDITQYRSSITKAFEQLDVDALCEMLTQIAEFFSGKPSHHAEAMDTASNLLYLAVSLLPDGEETLNGIFPGEDGYRCLYNCRTTVNVVDWICALRDGLCQTLKDHRQNYKSRTINKIKQYISDNLDRKFSLNEVAAAFGLSPSYLSKLFTKYADCTFVEFTTNEKIAAAKAMLAAGDDKIYTIAEKLGFDSAFYFSKVFKKVAGCSPREYMQKFQARQ